MKFINLEQNSESWAEYRLGGIGASDSAIIMNASKYATPHELFLEKTKQAPPKKANEFITQLGHKFEPRVLGYMNIVEDAFYQPKIVEMEEYPWLRASLDGFYNGKPLEIKYVGAEKLAFAKQKIVQDKSHWIQMQKQMMVTGADDCLYCCYTLDSSRKVIDEVTWFTVPYDKEYVLDELWPKEFAFWQKVLKKTWVEPQS